MSLKEAGLTHLKIDDLRVAGIVFNSITKDYAAIHQHLKTLMAECEAVSCGPARLVYHFETAAEGKMDLEVCVPVTEAVNKGDIKTRTLKGGEALSIRHPGAIETLNESSQKVYAYMRERGLPPKEPVVVFTEFHPDNPENNLIDVQAFLHPWTHLFSENLQRVLGEEVAKQVMQGSETITVESSMDERCAWIRGAMDTLDEVADDAQKYEALTPCAHVFPQSLIDIGKEVYQRNHDIDELIDFMLNGHPGFSKLIEKEGDILYATKRPADSDTYDKATTSAEKRKAACFCPMIRHKLDAGISPTFCNCSAGWFRQTWEGILGKPVQVEILETVLKGDEFCRFAIHLPEDTTAN
jgi:effector-binding domain-containing protein